MLPSNYQELKAVLSKKIDPKRIITNPLQLLAYGTDASFYRLIPKIVVQVHSEDEAVEVITQTARLNIPVTYRAAGTSLSGQAITDSVLMVVAHHWKKYTILDDGMKIRLQPGITGSRANIFLVPYGRKIGPDPASINAAMIGGIAANNASGMCCGTSQNSYKTIADIRIVFYDGTILDTADEASRKAFTNTHPEIIKGIEDLRDEIKADSLLLERIRKKFKIKNTTGYSINALVDYDDPFDIIKHLMIGSEGTLAFISDLTYHTVKDEKYKACALMIFDTIEKACEATPLLKTSPVSAVELLDRDCIRSVEIDPDAPAYFKTLPETACVLLVEIQADDETIMREKETAVRQSVQSIPTIQPYTFTSNPKEYSFNWKARKGLLSSVGGLRRTGTTCLIEDVAFPVSRLAEACIALKDLFKRLEYKDAVLFGHALEGNLHLTFSQDFTTEKEVERYAKLMDELADIVVNRFDGSLKAEHGTGRNMAPFVEMEWGAAAYSIMTRLKDIFDPHKLINPGVIINENPKIHLENLKPLPVVSETVDKCMECGFCEPNCVSEGLTLSPRQRIVIAREIERLKSTGKKSEEQLNKMLEDAKYFVDETCATDGLCGLICPVNIDTGKFVKEIRHAKASETAKKNAAKIGQSMDRVTAAGRVGLNFVNFWHTVLGTPLMGGIANGMRSISGNRIPKWNKDMPKGAHKIKHAVVNAGKDHKVVYFPSCINRTMGKSKGYDKDEIELTRKTEELLIRAGFTIIYPENLNNLCCGMAFSSKGLKEEGARKSHELEAALYKASEGGKYPVLFDMSPCFYTFHEVYTMDIKIYDPIEFMLKHVMPKLQVKAPKDVVTVFPVCSAKKIGMEKNLVELSKMCAKKVVCVESNCCGFAGDRGFTYPELNEHGLRHLSEQIPDGCKEGYSTSRTCEIGMSEQSNINFKSIFYLIDEVTR